MGSNSSRSHEAMVDFLVKRGSITDPNVEKAYRLTDRARFVPMDKLAESYRNNPIRITSDKYGKFFPGPLHLSSPDVYARVLSELDLQPGHVFLNVGSGCGWLSTAAGFLLGDNGINIGIDVYQNIVNYADEIASQCEKLAEFHVFPWTRPRYHCLNALSFKFLNNEKEEFYDRIYVGASLNNRKVLDLLLRKLKIGGVLIVPMTMASTQREKLSRFTRISPTRVIRIPLSDAAFAPLLSPDLPKNKDIMPPEENIHSLKHLCRIKIRSQIREKLNAKGYLPKLKQIHKMRGPREDEIIINEDDGDDGDDDNDDNDANNGGNENGGNGGGGFAHVLGGNDVVFEARITTPEGHPVPTVVELRTHNLPFPPQARNNGDNDEGIARGHEWDEFQHLFEQGRALFQGHIDRQNQNMIREDLRFERRRRRRRERIESDNSDDSGEEMETDASTDEEEAAAIAELDRENKEEESNVERAQTYQNRPVTEEEEEKDNQEMLEIVDEIRPRVNEIVDEFRIGLVESSDDEEELEDRFAHDHFAYGRMARERFAHRLMRMEMQQPLPTPPVTGMDLIDEIAADHNRAIDRMLDDTSQIFGNDMMDMMHFREDDTESLQQLHRRAEGASSDSTLAAGASSSRASTSEPFEATTSSAGTSLSEASTFDALPSLDTLSSTPSTSSNAPSSSSTNTAHEADLLLLERHVRNASIARKRRIAQREESSKRSKVEKDEFKLYFTLFLTALETLPIPPNLLIYLKTLEPKCT